MKEVSIVFEILYKPQWFSFKPFKIIEKKSGIETVCCWTGISSTDFHYEETKVVDSYKTVEEAKASLENKWSFNKR